MNRNAEMMEWVEVSRRIHKRRIMTYAYANNHFAGFAPDTVKLFQKLWEKY